MNRDPLVTYWLAASLTLYVLLSLSFLRFALTVSLSCIIKSYLITLWPSHPPNRWRVYVCVLRFLIPLSRGKEATAVFSAVDSSSSNEEFFLVQEGCRIPDLLAYDGMEHWAVLGNMGRYLNISVDQECSILDFSGFVAASFESGIALKVVSQHSGGGPHLDRYLQPRTLSHPAPDTSYIEAVGV
ncbi:hypothetical protein GGR57DRAFT_456113 [Xylariaceae sp. FL1272]|nr:hypothetical protein GGR57DRAFT_456113 [Xylariaceae sp. FL1272]